MFVRMPLLKILEISIQKSIESVFEGNNSLRTRSSEDSCRNSSGKFSEEPLRGNFG